MKQVLPLIVFLSVSSAFATQKVCDITARKNSAVLTSTEKLQVYVMDGVDLASYVMDKNINGFDVFVSEVDGNYYASMTFGGMQVKSEGVDRVSLSSSYKSRSLTISCY